MKLKFFKLLFISLLFLLHKGLADNGFYPYGFSSQELVAGAGAALPIEANNVESNPALAGRMDNHLCFFGGTEVLTTTLNTAPARAGNKIAKRQTNILHYTPYGSFGLLMNLSDKWSFAYGSSGGNVAVKYDRSIDASNSNFNRRYMQTFALANPTIAYKFSCKQTYGISLIAGASSLKTDLARSAPPFAQTSGHNRYSYTLGIGARIGGFWVLSDWLNMGASMSTPIWFQRNNKYRDVLKHHLNVPAIARIGFDFHIQACTHLLFDIKEILWHEVKAFGSSLGWKNQTVFIIGLKQQLTSKLIASIGHNYGKSPIRSNNVFLNGLGLFIIEHQSSVGLQYAFNDCIELFAQVTRYFPHRLTDNGKGKLGKKAKGAIGRRGGYDFGFGLMLRY